MGFLNPKKAAQAKAAEVKGKAKALPGQVVESITKATCRRCGTTRNIALMRKDGFGTAGASNTRRGKSVQLYVCKSSTACSKAKAANATEGIVTHRRGRHPGPLGYGAGGDED